MNSSLLTQQPILTIIALSALSLVPFMVLLCTSFIKFAAVLSILRSALATPQIPPNTVITGLSLILSILVMFPVIGDIKSNCEKENISLALLANSEHLEETIPVASECFSQPVKQFLTKHAHEQELEMLREVFNTNVSKGHERPDFMILITAFVLSELKEAFQIGFLIFLPFIVIDLLVANILQAMGMVMLSPTTISLPFKLLMFVMADGWYLLIESLVTSYLP